VPAPPFEIVLVRHGETEWSRTGRHTGHTDVPLTDEGRCEAEAIGAVLRERPFALVLTSPLERAAETCRLAGMGKAAVERDELREWDYGEIRGSEDERHPAGTARMVALAGRRPRRREREQHDVAFNHGHLLRVLAAKWLGLEPDAGRLFALDPGTISVLGHERETAVLRSWNWKPARP
jgi:broad specificity phosphatase PhoE